MGPPRPGSCWRTPVYPEGRGFPEVELVFPQTAEYRAIAETVQPMWKEVLGVSTRLAPMENAAFVNWRNSRKDQLYHAFLGGWSNDFNDPYNWHNFLFRLAGGPP